jgi:hypothetical protein
MDKMTKSSKIKFSFLYKAIILTIVLSMFVNGVAHAGDFVVPLGSANVDGNPGEWTEADFFADLYRAGHDDKPVEAKAYLRYDCQTYTLYVLVKTTEGIYGLSTPEDAWVRDVNGTDKLVTGNSGDDGVPPDFQWINNNGTHNEGFEASITLSPGRYPIEVHINVWDDDENQTSSNSRQGTVILIVCNDIPELPLGTITAVVTPLAATGVLLFRKKYS